MTFDEVLEKIQELLQREQRVSYRGLKRRFDLDDEYLEDIKEELIGAKRLAIDEEGRFLVWTGKTTTDETENRGTGESTKEANDEKKPEPSDQYLEAADHSSVPSPQPLAGERRQLTVMFIDLVDSTTLSQQLDPEEYHARVVTYQTACRQVIARYEGHVAQYLGDGILVYFGYPAAHEDDASRAVRSGLECVTVVRQLAYAPPLQVRIGVHTGPVVVGEIGAGERTEMLALGETPNIAARVQGMAEPDTVVMSAVTQYLVQGLFECQDLGPQTLKGISTPLSLYRVIGESAAHSRFEAAVQKGLTPLVGREAELGMLRQRWAQAKDGVGQVVLLGGEPGIGKSRLVQELKEQVNAEGATRIEFRCSPYYQNSAFYPIIEHLQRLLRFTQENTPQDKLAKLQQALLAYRFPQADTLPLFAALLSLPHPEGVPPLTLSPQKQKQLTLEALVAWLLEEAERAVVYCAWEDLHWADPSTLEILTMFLDQAPTARVLTLLTFRPEFTPPWGNRSHFSQLSLSRLGRQHVETMVKRVTGGKPLPAAVVQQIVAKTDGVPLFVEELTKTVVESGLVREEDSRYVSAHGSAPIPPLAIPATLYDSLMARLDRLAPIKEIAQLGATIGREFSYELLQAVSLLDETTLQQGLKQLVEAELVYQRGLPPQARYIFKHALIQDTAYQSLLKSKRQQLHQQIAQVLEGRFAEAVETQPELLAHHYTEAGLAEQAIPYWQKAGQRASQRSAHHEAIAHLGKGLEVLATLPNAPERTQQELSLQVALGVSLVAVKGYAAPEVEQVYTHARMLCQQAGETPQLFQVLRGLSFFYLVRGYPQPAVELAEQLLSQAERQAEIIPRMLGHYVLAIALFHRGDHGDAKRHFDQAIAAYDNQQHRHLAHVYGSDIGVGARSYVAWPLWFLGYSERALQQGREALSLAQESGHPFSLVLSQYWLARLHELRVEAEATSAHADEGFALATQQGFALYAAFTTIAQGWVLTQQGRLIAGIAKMRQGIEGAAATGAGSSRPYFLALLAEAISNAGQPEEGLLLLAEALDFVGRTKERFYEAELYRLKGELLLARAGYKI